MSQRIKRQWDEYTRKTMPPNVSTVQRWETRRAFYAGALALLSLILGELEPGTDDATANDLKMMDEIDAELKAFYVDVKEGRA